MMIKGHCLVRSTEHLEICKEKANIIKIMRKLETHVT